MKTPLALAPSLFIFIPSLCTLLLWDMNFLPSGVIPVVAVLISAGSMMFFSQKAEPSWFSVFFLILALSFSASFFMIWKLGTEPDSGGYAVFEAEVVDERPWGSKRVAVIRDGKDKYLLKMSPASIFRPGEILEVKGLALAHKSSPEDGDGFNERRYWMARGVEQQIIPYEITRIERKNFFSIPSWRSSLRTKIDTILPPPLRGYILASWLGVKDPALREDHTRWGTAHLLAVSGFHVGLIAGLAFFVLRRLKYRAVLISIIMWLYVFLTGFHASAFRAGIMLQLVLLGEMLGRPVTGINSVSVAGTLMLLYNPWYFWDTGWRLSICAVFSILSYLRAVRSVKLKVLVSPVVWITTYPVISSVFGSVPVAGILINLFAIPAFALILPVISIFALLAIAKVPLAGPGSYVSGLILHWWKVLCDHVTLLMPFSISWSLPLALLSLNIGGILLLRAVNVPWTRVLILILAGNVLVPFLSGSLVV